MSILGLHEFIPSFCHQNRFGDRMVSYDSRPSPNFPSVFKTSQKTSWHTIVPTDPTFVVKGSTRKGSFISSNLSTFISMWTSS
jgi:hypothetical protein